MQPDRDTAGGEVRFRNGGNRNGPRSSYEREAVRGGRASTGRVTATRVRAPVFMDGSRIRSPAPPRSSAMAPSAGSKPTGRRRVGPSVASVSSADHASPSCRDDITCPTSSARTAWRSCAEKAPARMNAAAKAARTGSTKPATEARRFRVPPPRVGRAWTGAYPSRHAGSGKRGTR